MNDNLDQLVSRRSFLRHGSCAALGLAGLTSQLFSMRAMGAMLDGKAFTDYRALVCVFLFGGNDSGNTLIPFALGEENYDTYASQRTSLAIPQSTLEPHTIDANGPGSRRFALHPALDGLRDLYNQGNVAILSNVGTLLFPMNRQQYRDGTVPRPPQLFGHNTQQEQWQLSRPDVSDGLGWGGRIADAVQALGANDSATVSMNISLSGNSRFLTGRDVAAYAVSSNGPKTLRLNEAGDRTRAEQALLDMIAIHQDPTHPASTPMSKVIADVTKRSHDNGQLIDALLQQGTQVTTPTPDNNLARQLAMVARLIEFGRTGLGHQRQIFFVATGGFDTHDNLLEGQAPDQGIHAGRLREVNDALVYFWQALGDINMRDSVTTFTASDFGRTYRSNGDGSDHGWGAHHFVMGGNQVDGGKVYGDFPSILLDGPQDSGSRGTFIPTTSVDAYGFELAKWMGVPLSEMDTVFPHIGRFLDVNNPSSHLGILA
ncbi:MAG: DUF1501 domain-containing protein [Phycisphaerales bacterium]